MTINSDLIEQLSAAAVDARAAAKEAREARKDALAAVKQLREEKQRFEEEVSAAVTMSIKEVVDPAIVERLQTFLREVSEHQNELYRKIQDEFNNFSDLLLAGDWEKYDNIHDDLVKQIMDRKERQLRRKFGKRPT